MYGLEYSSLILDVVLGFICTILGLLHYFDVAKPFEKITGIIGLATGIVGFIMTLVYICYSGYIFTNDYTDGFESNFKGGPYLLKLDKDGAFAEWDSGQSRYKCLFYKSGKAYSLYTKYNDLGKRQYNYEKKRHYDKESKYINCIFDGYSLCNSDEYFDETAATMNHNNCPTLYLNKAAETFENKYVFDRWVTTIIFSCFIAACCIGLAIFGFLLFKSDGSGL